MARTNDGGGRSGVKSATGCRFDARGCSQGAGEKVFIHEASSWIVLRAGACGLMFGLACSGWIGAILGLGAGLAAGGWFAESSGCSRS